jgi:hypothetical protein
MFLPNMSVQEIQAQLGNLTPQELTDVERHIRVLRVITAPGYKERIAAAHRRMDAGEGVSSEEFEARVGRDGDDAAAR